MFVHLRKRSHNRLSSRLCTEAKKYMSPQLVSWSIPVVLKVWVDTQTSMMKGQKWITPRRSKPELCIFNVTSACLCLSLA